LQNFDNQILSNDRFNAVNMIGGKPLCIGGQKLALCQDFIEQDQQANMRVACLEKDVPLQNVKWISSFNDKYIHAYRAKTRAWFFYDFDKGAAQETFNDQWSKTPAADKAEVLRCAVRSDVPFGNDASTKEEDQLEECLKKIHPNVRWDVGGVRGDYFIKATQNFPDRIVSTTYDGDGKDLIETKYNPKEAPYRRIVAQCVSHFPIQPLTSEIK